jgi:hypothetical protein
MSTFHEFSALKRFVLRLIEQFSFLGIHLYQLSNLRNLPRFFRDLQTFRKMGGGYTGLTALLNDYDASAGVASGHYFHQDLLIARYIFEQNPEKHFDFGSRVDGFVAHLASFRDLTLMDIRGLEIPEHPQISFKVCDIMQLNEIEVAESLSCLHTLEHIGLGRYGDEINPNGHILAFNNLLNFVKSGGVFYLSFPISNSSKVYFNRERVMAPTDLLSWSDNAFEVEKFDYVDDKGNLHLNQDLNDFIPRLDYGCGIYTLRKH